MCILQVLNLTGELQAAKMENQDNETKLKDLVGHVQLICFS
jgi:hypothetical protein